MNNKLVGETGPRQNDVSGDILKSAVICSIYISYALEIIISLNSFIDLLFV